ncbi:amino acid adenylation domain-containing protein [Aeromicrobium fastidiosum]|uniref:amino acid adenylation domain-containing protein n=1 Tax=Aeromicrobium fastidiosum TaxID=52699 RepID=UPI001AEA2EF6|nr:amino acid adenylation domain-containing protein [Aeromicrobium fastidiosum]MBP2390302.1 amino acid adenylation domain-containing protein/non-ribosomal peptide synthase protein (TIGR01720 family) [Aeromicrobium fastidiosum]
MEFAPDSVALTTSSVSVTASELWDRAIAMSRQLREVGVREADLVAVQVPRGPDVVVAMLGTWLSGAAFVPIDQSTPDERRAEILSRSGAAATIETGLAVRGLDTTKVPRDAAYVIYTSGSTGSPKGVVVGHDALRRHTDDIIGLLGLSSGSVVLQFASIAFDVAQEEIWPTLVAGGTVAFFEGPVPDVAELGDVTSSLGVTVLQLPTAYWRLACQTLTPADAPLFAGVAIVVIGGENATALDLAAHRASALGHTTLVNGYGPTEAVVTATAFTIGPHDPLPTSAGLPIGTAVGDRVAHVVDAEGRPTTAGDPGELWIGGSTLADGYLDDPDQTADRFRPDPWSDSGTRMYRTGDLVVEHSTGQLEFLGRVDNQVKVRGHRIELEEIDRHLLEANGVTAAVAFVLDDGAGGSVLGAAVTGSSGLTSESIRREIGGRVPSYLVPTVISVTDSLPLTTSGKIDRRRAADRLSRPAAVPSSVGDDPLSVVVGLMRELLLDPGIGPDDDFIGAGGDSLMAMRISAHARDSGLPLRPTDLLHARTARAAVDRAIERSDGAASRAPEEAGPVAMLPAQHRWLHDGPLVDPDQFCLNALFSTDPGRDVDELVGVVQSLRERHPALRTALLDDGSVRLGTNDIEGARDAVRVVDLRDVPPSEQRSTVEQHLADAQTSLSLSTGRVLQLLVLELGDGSARMLLTVHHFVLDGVSVGLLVDDLENLLAGAHVTSAVTGPRAVGEALTTWLTTAEARQDARDWATSTRPFAALRATRDDDDRLPTLRTDRFRLSAKLTSTMTELGRQDIPTHAFVLCCLAGGLARWSGETTHGVDVYAHSRDIAVGDLDLSRTVAYVQSTFPVVVDWQGSGRRAFDAAFGQLAQIPVRRYGFDALRFCSPDADVRQQLSSLPRPAVRLNFRGHLLRLEQRATEQVLRPATEDFGAHRSPRQRERYLLMVEGDIVDGELEVSLKYSTGRWDPSDIARLAASIEDVMTEVLDESAAPADGGHL